jgi:hypothetical protein
MRMTASWCRSSWIDRIQVCGAMLAPDGELPSDRRNSQHLDSNRPIQVLWHIASLVSRRLSASCGCGTGASVGEGTQLYFSILDSRGPETSFRAMPGRERGTGRVAWADDPRRRRLNHDRNPHRSRPAFPRSRPLDLAPRRPRPRTGPARARRTSGLNASRDVVSYARTLAGFVRFGRGSAGFQRNSRNLR